MSLTLFFITHFSSQLREKRNSKPKQNSRRERARTDSNRIEVQDSWSFSSEKAKTFVIVHFRKSDYIEIKIQEPATKTEFECFVIYCFHRLSVQWRGSDKELGFYRFKGKKVSHVSWISFINGRFTCQICNLSSSEWKIHRLWKNWLFALELN